MAFRPVAAFVPHRGMVWTGVSRPVVSVLSADGRARGFVVRLLVRGHVEEGAVVPGAFSAWQSARAATIMPPRRKNENWPVEGTDVVVRGAGLPGDPGDRVMIRAGDDLADLLPVGVERHGRLEASPIPFERISIETPQRLIFGARLSIDVRLRLDWLSDLVAYPWVVANELRIDLDSGSVEILYEAVVEGRSAERGLERVSVAIVPQGFRDSWWRELPRAVFGWVATEDDVREQRTLPPLDAAELADARWSTWAIDESPERSLSFEETADIHQRVAGGEALEKVLESVGIDGYEWQVEEHALLMAMASPPEVSEEELEPLDLDRDSDESSGSPVGSAALVDEARRFEVALGGAVAPEIPILAFARIAAAIETGEGDAALKDASISVATFAAVERVWGARADADEIVAHELDEAMEVAREERLKDLSTRLSSLAEEPIDLETDGA